MNIKSVNTKNTKIKIYIRILKYTNQRYNETCM